MRRRRFAFVRVPLRVAVLGLVIVFAAIIVVPTARQQIAHERQLQQLREQVADAKDREEDLTAELKRWDDPAYVQSQARTRLGYGMPGETAYRVLNPEAAPTEAPVPLPTQGPAVAQSQKLPWYLRLALTLEDAATPSDNDPDKANDSDKATDGTASQGGKGKGDGVDANQAKAAAHGG